MARKKQAPSTKAVPPKKAARAAAAPPAPRKKNLVVIKGFETWGEWLEGFASHENMPVTVLIDHSLREHARRRGYPDPPPRY